jgi:integrase
MRFKVLSDHYCQHEMPMDDHEHKAFSTKNTNHGYLRKWIVPEWGEHGIAEITPVMVEKWLKTLTREIVGGNEKTLQKLADGSKAKIRNLMSAIYRHAMRHGFIAHNPITLVRQGSKRRKAPEILTVEEIQRLLAALRPRERTMVLLDVGSGLRRGELFGLMWGDIELQKQQIFVRRSIVNQVAGRSKTQVSQKLRGGIGVDELGHGGGSSTPGRRASSTASRAWRASLGERRRLLRSGRAEGTDSENPSAQPGQWRATAGQLRVVSA